VQRKGVIARLLKSRAKPPLIVNLRGIPSSVCLNCGHLVFQVGIVVKDNLDGTITTIEGNTSQEKKAKGSQANGGEVAERIRAYKKNNKRKLAAHVVGFGRPKWSK